MKRDQIEESGIKIILDTDVGSDCDDMLALACLLRAERDHRAQILAVTHCLRTEYGPPAISASLRYFGRDNIPVGAMEGGAMLSDYYAKRLLERFGNASDMHPYPNSVSVLREALAASDGGVTLIAIGQFTNIAALIRSSADSVSDLSGVELIRQKCARIVVMGGRFAADKSGVRTPEWNIKWDIDAAKCVFDTAPVPIIALPSETGTPILSGKRLMEKFGDKNPVTHAYFSFLKEEQQRPSWDPMTVIYALGLTEDLLVEGPKGRISLDDAGVTCFDPCEDGLHSVLTIREDKGLPEDVALAAGEFIDSYAEGLLDRFCI